LIGGIRTVGGVRFACQKPALDAIYDVAAKVGCSGGVAELFSELIDELVTPSCAGLAGVGSIAFGACIGCSAASLFPNADWYPSKSVFDHKCLDRKD
jgi:hypothetical protein